MIRRSLLVGYFIVFLSSNVGAWAIDGRDYVGMSISGGVGELDGYVFTKETISLEVGRRFDDIYMGAIVDYSVHNEKKNATYKSSDIDGGSFSLKAGYSPVQAVVLYGVIGVSFLEEKDSAVGGLGLRINPFDHIGFFVEAKESTVTILEQTYSKKSIDGGMFFYLRF